MVILAQIASQPEFAIVSANAVDVGLGDMRLLGVISLDNALALSGWVLATGPCLPDVPEGGRLCAWRDDVLTYVGALAVQPPSLELVDLMLTSQRYLDIHSAAASLVRSITERL